MVNESNPFLKDAQNEVILTKTLLGLWDSLLQWQLEDEAFKSASTYGLGSGLSPALQSYLYHTNEAVRKWHHFSQQIPKIILKYTYPLFNNLRNLENQVLIARSQLWEGGGGKAFG